MTTEYDHDETEQAKHINLTITNVATTGEDTTVTVTPTAEGNP